MLKLVSSRSIYAYRTNLFQRMNIRTMSGNVSLDLGGVFPPVATPFDDADNIDYKALAHNFTKWNSMPFKGFVVFGTNGESAYLDTDEKVALVKNVKAMASEGKTVIAGCGCESTRATISLAKQMSDVGADAMMVLTPSYYKGGMTDEALYQHYTKVADGSPKPVILYSMPLNTTIDLAPDVIVKLAAHPNIIGIKDSGGQVQKMGSVAFRTRDLDFQVLAGSAGFLYPGYTVGCVGAICALANVLGDECCELDRMFRAGEHSSATLLQQRLIAPNLAVTAQHGVPGLKSAMQWFGYRVGSVRSPLQPLGATQQQALRDAFTGSGFTPK